MKKIALTLFVMFFAATVAGQVSKTALFVGIYEKNKRGICSDYGYVTMEIANFSEYAVKRNQFDEAGQKKNARAIFVGTNDVIIIYSYEKKIAGWNCKSNVVSYIKAKSLEQCHKELADKQAKNPDDFATPPKIDFTWPPQK